MADDSNDLYIR